MLHMAAWIIGVEETWLALAAMRVRPGAGAAFAAESLGMAARSARLLAWQASEAVWRGRMQPGGLAARSELRRHQETPP